MASKKIILTVDDQPVNLASNKMILQNYFDVRIAKTGKMALLLLERIPMNLVLLDINMPEMTGLELLKKIKISHRENPIPVIFVTSHGSVDYITQAVGQGASDYIIKPIAPRILLAKVSSLLGIPVPSPQENAANAGRNPAGSTDLNPPADGEFYIHRKLTELKAACESGNPDALESLLKKLKRTNREYFGLAISKLIDEISDLAMLFDYELILRKLEGVLITMGWNRRV
jgi:response regulator RpfG family c-di-GMP phosphodiesterase